MYVCMYCHTIFIPSTKMDMVLHLPFKPCRSRQPPVPSSSARFQAAWGPPQHLQTEGRVREEVVRSDGPGGNGAPWRSHLIQLFLRMLVAYTELLLIWVVSKCFLSCVSLQTVPIQKCTFWTKSLHILTDAFMLLLSSLTAGQHLIARD